MAYFSTTDLARFRADYLAWGIPDWDIYRAQADSQINRELEYSWYRGAAEEQGLDWRATRYSAAKLLTVASLDRMASYLTLALAAETLTRGDDAFAKTADRMRDAYQRELKAVLAVGVDYDWDADSTLDDDERYIKPMPRRVKRC